MLVLSATYYNKWLKTLVPVDRFWRLLERTITFLRRLAPISPSCADDCVILEKITQLVFGGSPAPKQVYRKGAVPVSASTLFGPSM